MSSPGSGASLDAATGTVTPIAGDTDEPSLARDMIAVHGTEAAAVARGNARGAALAGQATQAKRWIRVLGIVQRHQSDKTSPHRDPGNPPPSLPAAQTTQG